ncbi:MAG: tetratricopeptide repeat protein [Cytophagales bacterium]|nr:tetratricopeptide repeat protein [Armatimonadota bacterium]
MAASGPDTVGLTTKETISGGLPPAERTGEAGEITREMTELAVGPLLARANLLRMRGQWDEAVAVCTEALRRAPESPTAHSVLGDIYEAQGKLEDALQWYSMAVDLAPTRQSDREKLEQVVAAQRVRLRTVDKARAESLEAYRQQMTGKLGATPPSGVTSSTGGRAAAERTVEWFDRVFPPGRSESIARLIFTMCGVIAVMIFAAVLFVYTSTSRSKYANLAEGGTNAGSLPTLSAPRPPVLMEVPPSARPAAAPTPAASSPAATKPARAGGAAPVSASDPVTVQARVERSLPPGVRVLALDGTGGSYQMAVALPRAASETTAATQERVLRGAALAARALSLVDSRATQAIVRASLQNGVSPTGAGTSIPASPDDVPVFIGTVALAGIRANDPSLTPTATLQAQFTGAYWSSALTLPVPPTAPATLPVVPATPAAAPMASPSPISEPS